MFSISRTRAISLLVIFLAVTSFAAAQDIRNPQSAIDNRMRTDLRVDPVSHALQFQIPLGQYPGRGGRSLPITLYYSSKLWNIKYANTIQCQDDPGSLYFAEYARSSASGWTSSLDWFSWRGDISLELYDPYTSRPTNKGTVLHKIARMHVTLPDGSRHELRKDDDFHAYNENISGLFYSVDGSRLIYDTTTGTLYLPDGSRYVATSSGQTYIDRNGNQLSYDSTNRQWTDTLGRVIGLPLATTAVGDSVGLNEQEYTYSIPGVGGTSLTYTLRWKHLSTAGVINEQETDQTLRYKGDHTTNCQSGTDYSGLFHSTEADFNGLLKSNVFDPVVLYQVVLPTGQAYTFKYNIYGEITKVIYPTGGYERFSFGGAPLLSAEDAIGIYSQANRGVTDAWISADGTTVSETHWIYSGFSTTAPDGTRTDRLVFTNPYDWSAYGFEDPRLGMVYDERVYAPGPNGQMLRRKLTDYAVDGGPPVLYGTYYAYKQRKPRPTKEVEIILDTGGNALTTTTTYQYDADLNPTVTNHYDFASVDQTTAQTGAITAMPQGALLRTDEATFLVNDPNISSSTQAAYRARNLLSLPTSTRVKDGAGNIVAQSFVNYDEAAYPLLTYGAITGWSDPGTTVRGNATTSGVWLNTTGAYLQTHAQYDQGGSVRNAWDAKGNQSQVEYSSTYAYAYPTLTRSAVPDPSGAYGSNISFVSTSAYDFNTGLVTSTTDANNVTTTFAYNDSLNRLTQTVRASGTALQNQTTVNYDDINRIITTTSDLNAYNDNLLVSKVLYDALGRTIETRQYEGSGNYIAAQRQYDSLGRAYKTSNPFRPWQSEVAIWTTSAFDALGRVVSVTTPDSAVVTSSYSGNTVTVTDQTGKTRKSVTDGLGRLAQVYEDPSGLNYLTSYSYDTLDSLTTVSQGSQTRTFVYDSLKRLTSATNPESATVSYQYDNNGNLSQKTDARGVASTYGYDALNRNTTVTYTNDPNATLPVSRVYDLATNGKGRLYQSLTTGAAGSLTTVDSYDALGCPLSERQQFYASGAWSQSYTTQRGYNLAGSVTSQVYPSGHSVTYNYDKAGRLGDKDAQNPAFTGNLGDGSSRNYSSEILYTPLGGLSKEKFGTDPAIYNKLFYNSRGQLAEIRESTGYTGPTDTTWDRGAIINYYSNNCWGMCGGTGSTTAMTDNNGNLKKQEVFIPGASSWLQQYDYDSLNRLQRVHETTGNTALDWQQEYVYDRYGNRTINGATDKTFGNGVNSAQMSVSTVTNRMYGPGETDASHTQVDYDAAGNQTKDLVAPTGAGTRVYDAENRMMMARDINGNQSAAYGYDSDGRRVRRNVNGVETWQVYGFDGELLAEYAANASAASPQKEYGYRNGQLLITADAPSGSRINVALASNGGVATASSAYPGGTYGATAANNGDRKGAANSYWNDAAPANTFPDWLQVDFNGSKTIDEIDVFTEQDNWQSPSEPTETMSFSLYGLSGYEVQYWNGSAWVDVSGGNVSGNNKIWRKFTFAAITTSKIRILTNASADGYSRLTEVEAWTPRTNFALASNGGVATASSAYPGGTYGATAANNGDRKGAANSYWNDAAAANTFPDWLQIDFNGSKTIDEIDVFTEQDNWQSPSEPTETMTFALYGLTGYDVQYWNGSAWATVTGGSVTGNNKVWRKFTFSAITTTKIRVLTNASSDGYSRLTELEAWEAAAGGGTNATINWLVTDQLGTPRMLFDKTGALANLKRHDYLPFGEELFAGTGGRTTALGYIGDSVRQKFTLKERDNETGLDYFNARYYSSTQGRFTSADPLLASGNPLQPQSWNRYTYCVNNPLINVDPTGLWWYTKNGGDGHPEWHDDDPGDGYTRFNQDVYWAGESHGYVALDHYSKNWQEGFETEGDAGAFSNALSGETMQARDPGQYVSQLEGTLEMSGYISGVTGLVRLGGMALAEGAAEETLTSIGTEVAASQAARTPQIILNRLAGKAAEKLVGEELVSEGNTILGSNVAARTSQGLRFIDHLIETPGGDIMAVEVKSGGAVRSALQVAKDNLMSTEGATLVGKNAPARLVGQTLVIQTVVRTVPK